MSKIVIFWRFWSLLASFYGQIFWIFTERRLTRLQVTQSVYFHSVAGGGNHSNSWLLKCFPLGSMDCTSIYLELYYRFCSISRIMSIRATRGWQQKCVQLHTFETNYIYAFWSTGIISQTSLLLHVFLWVINRNLVRCGLDSDIKPDHTSFWNVVGFRSYTIIHLQPFRPARNLVKWQRWTFSLSIKPYIWQRQK